MTTSKSARSIHAALGAALGLAVLVRPAAQAQATPEAESTPENPGMACIEAEHAPRPKAVTTVAKKVGSARQLAFRNTVVPAPPGWTGPFFHLSHNYPQQEPAPCPKDVCRWLAVDVNFAAKPSDPPPAWYQGWDKYIAAILDYLKEGQDPQLRNEIGWRVKVGQATRWFHVPWMAYDPRQGREFVHGMTNERTAKLEDFLGGGEGFAGHRLQLGAKDVAELGREGRSHLLSGNLEGGSHGFETWAFGVYNPAGGWSVGQAWLPDGRPAYVSKGGQTFPAGMPFPPGTLVAKLLFTTASAEEVPYLKDSPTWIVDRHEQAPDGAYVCKRSPQPVHLVQVDVAVVDPRSPTRWVYGTFAWYADYGSGSTAWDHLAPVGLQWGMDEWTFPAVPRPDSIPAHQSVLRDANDPRQHLGCEHRLAGPVDNKLSSCLSCHSGAYAQPNGQRGVYGSTLPVIFGFTGQCTSYSQANVNYFQTTQFPMPYSGGNFPFAMSLDTSLQLQVAYMKYGDYLVDGKTAPCVSPSPIKPDRPASSHSLDGRGQKGD